MRLHPAAAILAASFVAACAGDTGDSEAVTQESAMTEASAEEMAIAAIEEIREGYVTNYNMHDPAMVADYYADEAVVLYADGTIADGREEIIAALERAFANSPTLNLERQGEMVFGDQAVAKGAWSVEMTPEGAPEPAMMSGHFMTHFVQVGEEWKIQQVVTNYDSEPPEAMEWVEYEGEAPEDLTGTAMSPVIEAYETHFNAGEADMVAALYAADGIAHFANQDPVEGRAAIAEASAAGVEAGGQLTIHEVNTEALGDGWYLSTGWFEVAGGDGDTAGAWMVLGEEAGEPGTIHWLISNSWPTDDGM